MAFPVLPVPNPGAATFNVDAQLFATGLAQFAQEANALGSVIDLSLKSTSTTSLTIGTGSKTLTVQTGLGYVIGHPVRIASVASPSNFMDGIVTAYNTGTGSLTVNVLSVGGSGTIASWNTMVLPGGGNFAGLSNNKFTGRQVFADEVTLASASTIDFTAGDSNQFLITGTTTINDITMAQGAVIKARFNGACQLTNGTNLRVQGGANYTTTAGDIATFTSNGTVVRVEISKVDGTAITFPPLETSTSDPTSVSTTDTKSSTPGWVNQYHIAKTIGRGQTYQDVTASRAAATTYTNSTGKAIFIFVTFSGSGGSANATMTINSVADVTKAFPSSAGSPIFTLAAIIHSGATYSITLTSATITKWVEMR